MAIQENRRKKQNQEYKREKREDEVLRCGSSANCLNTHCYQRECYDGRKLQGRENSRVRQRMIRPSVSEWTFESYG